MGQKSPVFCQKSPTFCKMHMDLVDARSLSPSLFTPSIYLPSYLSKHVSVYAYPQQAKGYYTHYGGWHGGWKNAPGW